MGSFNRGYRRGSLCLCVAVRRGVLCYEVNCDLEGIPRFNKIKEILFDFQPQFMSISNSGPHLIIGSQSGFTLYDLKNTRRLGWKLD